ncbi:MAG: hypothetical protein PHP86_17890 [Nevskiales bacterium]|nr:hypothetical protein [Nevskiales bacterium]
MDRHKILPMAASCLAVIAGFSPGLSKATSDCDFEDVAQWWEYSNLVSDIVPDQYQSTYSYAYMIFDVDSSAYYNNTVMRTWGSENCAIEAYVSHTDQISGYPVFAAYDWACDPICTAQGYASQQTASTNCSTVVAKNTLVNGGFVANYYNGEELVPVVYVIVNHHFDFEQYGHINRSYLWNFNSSSLWKATYNRTNKREVLSHNVRGNWIEYWYNWASGPGCTGTTHDALGVVDYHVRVVEEPDCGGSCISYTEYPDANNSHMAKTPSDLPVTVHSQTINDTWNVTKP